MSSFSFPEDTKERARARPRRARCSDARIERPFAFVRRARVFDVIPYARCTPKKYIEKADEKARHYLQVDHIVY
jgi:hypothetical protein